MHLVILYQHYLGPGEPGFSRFNEYSQRWIADGYKVSVVASQLNYMTGKKNICRSNSLIHRTVDANGAKVIRAYIPPIYQKSIIQKVTALCIFAITSTLATLFISKPDVILVSSPPLFMALPALFMNITRKVPYVIDIRDLWPESGYALGVLRKGSFFARILTWLERGAISKAKAVNVLTPAFREDLIQRRMAPPDKIYTIPNGVNLNKLNHSEDMAHIKQEFGWKGRFVVLYAGAHGIANHLEQLIDAAEILQTIPEILIACVGDGISLPELERTVQQKGLKNIHFYGPFSKEMTIKLVLASDVCAAVLKRADTFKKVYPNKAFEYMACGKPIILAIDGAARELVEKAKAGVFVPAEDPAAFAEAVRFLRQHPEDRRQMGLNGREYITKHFSLDQLYTQMTDLLRAVAEL